MNHDRKIIYLVGFIFSLSTALMYYINSSFLSIFVGEKLVGIVYALGSILSLVALLTVPQIFRKVGGYKFLLSVTLLDALSIILFAFSSNPLCAVLVFVFGFALNTTIVFSLDELLKIFSKDSETGKIRGVYITLSNLALIVGQVLYASFLGTYSFKGIYVFAFFVMMVFLLISCLSLEHVKDPNYDKTEVLKYVRNFFKKKNLFRAYVMSFLIQFFYCWMVIYTPIYLSIYLRFSWKEIGIIFAIMLLPFTFMPFSLGKYSDQVGERKMLMFGFAVASITTLSLFLIQTYNMWIWALFLFITRIGAATIEPMSDTYFFKHIRPENEEFVGVYRSASPIAYIIGPLLASILFLFIPSFNYIYIILGAIMLSGVCLASKISVSDI